jgi:hypothetical protein
MCNQPLDPALDPWVVAATEVLSRAHNVPGYTNVAYRSTKPTIRLGEHVQDSSQEIVKALIDWCAHVC